MRTHALQNRLQEPRATAADNLCEGFHAKKGIYKTCRAHPKVQPATYGKSSTTTKARDTRDSNGKKRKISPCHHTHCNWMQPGSPRTRSMASVWPESCRSQTSYNAVSDVAPWVDRSSATSSRRLDTAVEGTARRPPDCTGSSGNQAAGTVTDFIARAPQARGLIFVNVFRCTDVGELCRLRHAQGASGKPRHIFGSGNQSFSCYHCHGKDD